MRERREIEKGGDVRVETRQWVRGTIETKRVSDTSIRLVIAYASLRVSLEGSRISLEGLLRKVDLGDVIRRAQIL
eukprot:1387815-Amorphochlora_amoeboformis.AAC.1